MALDFPTPTTVGQVHSHGSLQFVWDGAKWKAAGDPSNASVPLAGGTMTGLLVLSGPPTGDLHAVTKKYTHDNFTPLGSWSSITEAP